MIKIKLVGQELSGNLYITERGTYIMDTNFSKSKDTSRMSLHTLSWIILMVSLIKLLNLINLLL